VLLHVLGLGQRRLKIAQSLLSLLRLLRLLSLTAESP
jgi:hypothetical protein